MTMGENMAGHYLCKIASPDEMQRKWAYEIDRNVSDRENWMTWREEALDNFREGKTIPYYGILDGEIICEATAVIDPEPARRSRGLVDEQTAYLEAFRTNEPFRGQGYFSRLFAFMLEDLRRRGYRRVTLGVETNDMKNKAIYTHYGFTGYLTTEQERYPDGTTVEVEYYAKTLFTDGISSEAGESPES